MDAARRQHTANGITARIESLLTHFIRNLLLNVPNTCKKTYTRFHRNFASSFDFYRMPAAFPIGSPLNGPGQGAPLSAMSLPAVLLTAAGENAELRGGGFKTT